MKYSLNRTMQYGNWLKTKGQKSSGLTGLNRTMQYGNDKMKTISGEVSSVFKSYYVVWKHLALSVSSFSPTSFKSYYVVWKRYRMRGNEHGKMV